MKKIFKISAALFTSSALLLNLMSPVSAIFNASGNHWYYSDETSFKYWGLTEVDNKGMPLNSTDKNNISFGGATPKSLFQAGRENYNVTVTVNGKETRINAKIGVKGDAVMDGKTDIRDAIFISGSIMKTKTFKSKFYEFLADYNTDGTVNIIDAIDICKLIISQSPPVSPQEKKRQEFVNEVLRLVNKERSAAKIPPLTLDQNICKAAQKRAVEISGTDQFSHIRPDGTDCFTVLKEMNISYWGCGENIAAGQTTPAMVMDSWMNSPGHRANILDPDFDTIGIGYYNSGKEYSHYWTQLFISK